ncbi:MAG: PIN domain-containing protein [Chloroflexota bacterium]
MKIYLDTSVYNRPFDDQTQPRIWLETLSLALILQFVESGEAVLVNSSVLEFENSRNPFALRQDWVNRCLRLSTEYKAVDDSIRKRAEQLEHLRIKALDALHVSCAEAAQASYFLTCDDRLISKRKYLNVRPLNPVEFVQKIIGVQP